MRPATLSVLLRGAVVIRESATALLANRTAAPVASPPEALKRIAVLIETDSSAGCRMIRGISNYAERHGQWHLLLDPRDHEHRSALPDGWHGHGIIARITSQKQLEQLQDRRLPLVNVDDVIDPPSGIASVITDEKALAEMALAHLLDRGFRQFAYFAPPSLDYSKRRGEAFAQHVNAAGYECAVYKPGYRAGRRLGWGERLKRVERWMRTLPKPIGVLAVDANRGRQLSEICHLSGVRVPDDVAVLGGSLDELLCDVASPPLSSINVASERIGHDAAQLLDAMMVGHEPPAYPIEVPPRGVQSRQSTDLLAIDDEEIVDALRYIRQHACRGIIVEDILRQVPISRRSLEIQFRKYLGRSPAREIRRVQLERSRDLLGRRELSITEVALACGFANATRFGVAFKKDTGKTPHTFRKELLAGQRQTTIGV